MPPLKIVLVKICGITNPEDAKWAANLGADFIGLNFCAESPRKVSIEKAQEIAQSLPSFVKVVGVLINPDPSLLEKILKKVPLHFLQLHGEETKEQMAELKLKFNLPLWKGVRVESEESLQKLPEFQGVADKLLLDTYRPGQSGGTGESFDWSLAVEAKAYGLPIFIAGGLKPENVKQAILEIEPQGVDVASGVEKEGHPRKKDWDKMKSFITIAKSV